MNNINKAETVFKNKNGKIITESEYKKLQYPDKQGTDSGKSLSKKEG